MADWGDLTICPNCGAANPHDGRVCVRCGVALQNALARLHTEHKARGKRRERSIAKRSGGVLWTDAAKLVIETATAEFLDATLFLDAHGEECDVCLVGVPFAGARGVEDLAGRVWVPDEDEMARQADVLCEGAICIRGSRVDVTTVRVACRSYDKRSGILSVDITATGTIKDGSSKVSVKITLACAVVARGKR